MDDAVTAELEALEELCLAATRNRPAPDDASTWLLAYACGALATLLHLGLITPEEDARWRERLQPAFGDDRRLTRWRIGKGDASSSPPGPPTADDEAARAYAMCRNLTLTQLAWTLHTAAEETAVTSALALGTADSDRVVRACRLGFDDRVQQVTVHREV
jgi:hypothetical protein